jgi:hypothetical protein
LGFRKVDAKYTDVENSKKIVITNDELTNKTEKPNLPTDFTLDYADIEEDDDNGEWSQFKFLSF